MKYKKVILLISLFVICSLAILLNNKQEDITPTMTKSIAIVNCSSNSMGLTMNCKDRLELMLIDNSTKLEEGKIYSYKSKYVSNQSIVTHRLIKDCSNGCYGYIFKGDNSQIADPIVDREDIKYKIIGVEYR